MQILGIVHGLSEVSSRNISNDYMYPSIVLNALHFFMMKFEEKNEDDFVGNLT